MSIFAKAKEAGNKILCLVCCIVFTGPVLMLIGVIMLIASLDNTENKEAAVDQWVTTNALWATEASSWTTMMNNAALIPQVKAGFSTFASTSYPSFSQVTTAASAIIESKDDDDFAEQYRGLPTAANAPSDITFVSGTWYPLGDNYPGTEEVYVNQSGTVGKGDFATGSITVHFDATTSPDSTVHLNEGWYKKYTVSTQSFNSTQSSTFISWYTNNCANGIVNDYNLYTTSRSYYCYGLKKVSGSLEFVLDFTGGYSTGAGTVDSENVNSLSWSTCSATKDFGWTKVYTTERPSITSVTLASKASPWTEYDGFGPTTLESAVWAVAVFWIGLLWTGSVVVCVVLAVKGCMSCFGMGKKDEQPAAPVPAGAQMPQQQYNNPAAGGYNAQQPPAYAQQPQQYNQGPPGQYTQPPPQYAQQPPQYAQQPPQYAQQPGQYGSPAPAPSPY
ncbi:hypothetical protein KIPB_000249 [Kipferlia bialata]|uniref:Uncharacterized protein n=1 Tax=Kipferlia bialata TaxID=797122 RepID=A0A9K3CNI1_9EUKA|nr:hypothetical protein KIPB_000249 [Kipferlia bialata]|eukprot:g249.t1